MSVRSAIKRPIRVALNVTHLWSAASSASVFLMTAITVMGRRIAPAVAICMVSVASTKLTAFPPFGPCVTR